MTDTTTTTSSSSNTTFDSHLLLKDEEMEKMGVANHNYEVYRRKHYQQCFGIETWYKDMKQHTFQTEHIELSYVEAEAIISRHHRRPMSGLHSSSLLILEHRLEEVIKNKFKGGCFVKLDTRSPKDVPVYAFENVGVKKLIEEEILQMTKEEQKDEDSITTAFVIATNKYMKITKGSEAVKIMCESTRVAQDLSKATEFGQNLFKASIVVREWLDSVPLLPSSEFRGFVYKNQLNALTQYFSFIRFPELVRRKQEYIQRIREYFESVKHLIPHESYVIDFFVLEDRIIIIELNPFHQGAGAGLFSWKTDRNLFMNGPFEARVMDTPASVRDPMEYIPPFWLRYIKEIIERPSKEQIIAIRNNSIILLLSACYAAFRLFRK
eukprot:TRINITY_DN4101_c0_g3_i1.p1 TRINITY_DN4101_c0_g3~~TRINITY_DN4101_c0_g3_i1.p1  ORF type:complete len:380 (-),score=102.02 TRINITY_DN4101_c0_g3_i1:62-1201(-)